MTAPHSALMRVNAQVGSRRAHSGGQGRKHRIPAKRPKCPPHAPRARSAHPPAPRGASTCNLQSTSRLPSQHNGLVAGARRAAHEAVRPRPRPRAGAPGPVAQPRSTRLGSRAQTTLASAAAPWAAQRASKEAGGPNIGARKYRTCWLPRACSRPGELGSDMAESTERVAGRQRCEKCACPAAPSASHRESHAQLTHRSPSAQPLCPRRRPQRGEGALAAARSSREVGGTCSRSPCVPRDGQGVIAIVRCCTCAPMARKAWQRARGDGLRAHRSTAKWRE